MKTLPPARAALSPTWVALGVVAFVAAVLGPWVIWPHELAVTANTYGRAYEPFEQMALGLTMVALVGAGLWVHRQVRRDGLHADRLVPVLASALVVVYGAGLVGEFSQESWDWSCYRDGAAAVLAGGTPYGRCYIYPPLLAQVLALVYRVMDAFQGSVGLELEQSWGLVFYIFQAGQVVALAALAWVGQRLARSWGLSAPLAALLVVGLLVFDNPVLRTIRHNQVNLWLLAFTLLAVEQLDRRPWVAGGLLALAVHVKLYPVVLVLPWILGRRWRAVGATLGATVLLAVVVTGRHPEQWQELVAFGSKIAAGQYFRNNSFLGLVINAVRLPLGAMGRPVGDLLPVLRIAGLGCSMVAGIWVLRRLWERHRGPETDAVRLSANTADLFAFQLLVSPLVWEHHFVLALPVAWHAVATRWRQRPAVLMVGVALVFMVPTADVFLLSHHRMAGLLLLLWATRGPIPGAPASAELGTRSDAREIGQG